MQEIAPLSYAFIGEHFLNPYVARFGDAINLAAAMRLREADGSYEQPQDTMSVAPTAEPNSYRGKHYTLVRANNVGYTAILLFAREPDRLYDLQEAEVGFGAAEMGNKGAVGLRALYDAGDKGTTELTFVATHLAAMEWNLPRRNANWAAIMRGLTFENPEAVLKRMRKVDGQASDATSLTHSEEEEGVSERMRLLHDSHHQQHLRLQQRLHDLSVFKPSSHLFVAGDLNYRISTASPPPFAAFPNLDPDSDNFYPTFFPLDQLTRERKAGRTLHGLAEHEVSFPPTYKYDVQSSSPSNRDDLDPVPWKFAPHRYPSWTDRILFLELPSWINSRMQVRAYNAMPVVRFSDHRAVYLRVDVPLVSPADLTPPSSILDPASTNGGLLVDPRIRLPVEIDPEAWERRAAARRRELLAGWSMFLWSTKQGACILATLLVAGLSGYWFYSTAWAYGSDTL